MSPTRAAVPSSPLERSRAGQVVGPTELQPDRLSDLVLRGQCVLAGDGRGGGMSDSQQFDVFVSYGHGDGPWVEVLAGNLVRSGLTVALDRWELIAGDLVAPELQKRLATSESVV